MRLVISFEEPLGLKGSIAFERRFPTCSPDIVSISRDGIEIRYVRSRALLHNALCKRRCDCVKDAVLVLTCMEGVESGPVLKCATLSADGKRGRAVELPQNLMGLCCEYSGRRFERGTAERSLGDGELAKALRISISYCWAASKAFSEEERLKLLWGSFNALYRYYAKSIGASGLCEARMLDEVNNLFLSGDVLTRSLSVFDSELSRSYESFVRWKLLTSSKSRQLYVGKETSKKKADENTRRLCALDKDTLMFMRDDGCGDLPSKARLKALIDHNIGSIETNSPLRKACMLLCRYIYIFRCDGVHANLPYPVFKAKEADSEKRVMGDLLEAAVIDFAAWLATGVARGSD